MREAVAGALLIAAVSTLGDFVWAGLHLRHRVLYGLAHGTLLFLCIGAYFGALNTKIRAGALYGASIGLAAAGTFYLLAPIAGYSAMFVVWAFIWFALAFAVQQLRPRPNASVLLRGTVAMVGSGLGFYLISDIWRPFNPRGWDYATHFLAWTVAYIPGFCALLLKPRKNGSAGL
jgi:hypothetical protein